MLSGGHAVVRVPHVDDDDADAGGVDAICGGGHAAGFAIAGLQGEVDLGGGGRQIARRIGKKARAGFMSGIL
jgi:hypothetical protein